MTTFLLSSNPEKLAEAIKGKRSITIEAEYGDIVVEGSILTLAHHGSRSGNPAPCLAEVSEELPEVIGLSHIDLDTIGGCMSVLGIKPKKHRSFWELAAFVDVNGPHKLKTFEHSDVDNRMLHAFWAFNETHKVFPPRDGSVMDVTSLIDEFMLAVISILNQSEEMLVAGDKFKTDENDLNESSFVEGDSTVIVRKADKFVNHLYVAPGEAAPSKSCVTLNKERKAITISFSDPIPGVSACDIAQSLWGLKAGGHAGIAGSPRDSEMSEEDLYKAVSAIREAIK